MSKSGKTSTSISAAVDPAAMLAAIKEAFNDGGAGMRSSVDTLTRALESREGQIATLQATVLALLDQVQAAARMTTELAVMGARERISLEELKSETAITTRALAMLEEPAKALVYRLFPALAGSVKPSNGGGDTDTTAEGRAATLRVVDKLLQNEALKEAIIAHVGADDWEKTCGYLMSLI